MHFFQAWNRHHLKNRLINGTTTCLVCLVSAVNGCRKNPLEEQALGEATKQNLSNLLFIDIYEARLGACPLLPFLLILDKVLGD
jgi:hypothetical protein